MKLFNFNYLSDLLKETINEISGFLRAHIKKENDLVYSAEISCFSRSLSNAFEAIVHFFTLKHRVHSFTDLEHEGLGIFNSKKNLS